MKRTLVAVIAGFFSWWVIATLGGAALHMMWPTYALLEKTMTFTLSMQIARLLVGAVASLTAGGLAAWAARPGSHSALWLGLVLLVFFLPVHYQLRNQFPLWYHLIFLCSLVPLSVVGAGFAGMRTSMTTPGSGGTAPRESPGGMTGDRLQ